MAKKNTKSNRAALWQKVELRPLSWLKENPSNARKHSEEQIEYIASLIQRFGWKSPILCDETGLIIAGHGRKRAAEKLGLEKAPCMIDSNLTAEEKEAYAIADNQSALLSTWDRGALKDAIDSLSSSSFDLSLLGFSDVELSAFVNHGQKKDPDAIPIVKKRSGLVRFGDSFRLGPHTLFCGDSTKLSKQTLSQIGKVQAVWTDPPYGVSYQGGKILNDSLADKELTAFLVSLMATCVSVLVPGGPLYVCHAGTKSKSFLEAWEQAGLFLSGILIWKKSSLVLGRSDWQNQHEPILYGWKPGAAHRWYGGRKMTSILEFGGDAFTQVGDDEWSIVSESGALMVKGPNISVRAEFSDVLSVPKPSKNEGHPTVKPTVLIERCLLPSTRKGDRVFDPCGGSGSTLIACEVTGRVGVVVELSPEYVELTIARWENLTGKKAKRLNR